MAYLPFYITPEKFQEYQKQRSESIENAPDVTRWMCKNVEHKYRHLRAVIWVIPVLMTALIFGGMMTFTLDEPVWHLSNPVVYALIIPLIIAGWAGYLSYGIDDRYDYTLSAAGLIYQKRLDEPLWGPRFVQIMAYIACGASILAVVIMGPLALVGSGGFLLLAFACTKKREINVEEWVVPSDQFVCARHFKKRKLVCLYAKKESCKKIGHIDYPDHIDRAQTRGSFFLFYKTEQQLTSICEILSNSLQIDIEEVDQPNLIFDFEHWPKPLMELRMNYERFHEDKTLTRFNDPAPRGKTYEESKKEFEELYGDFS